MPWAQNGAVRIHWEEQGSGEPLLLIMGLGMSLAMWRDLKPFLAQHFRTILFDNRCIGASGCPVLPFGVSAMAGDALAVLDAARVNSAKVFGISMGGMIAQELTLRHPNRVNGLILGCTHAGGLKSVLADARVLALLALPTGKPNEKIDALIRYMYHPNTPRERVNRDLGTIRANVPTLHGYMQQLTAIMRWSAWRRLPRIRVRTLVVHGDADLLVPTENARILARRIPGAELVILPNAGHMFFTDQPELTKAALIQFAESFRPAA